MRIVVVARRGLGAKPDEYEATWPVAWRQPQVGELISLPVGPGGYIEAIQWDLGSRTMRLLLR